MTKDGSKTCRLCLGEAQVVCPIFGGPHSKNQGVDLPQRIMSCAQIKVVEGDGLPASICHQCLAQVDKSYQFKLQCERADATLRKNDQGNSNLSISLTFKKRNGSTDHRNGIDTSNCDSLTIGLCSNGKNTKLNDTGHGNMENGDRQNSESGDDGDLREDVDETDDSDADNEDDFDDDAKMEGRVQVQPGLGDSESVDGWEVMKFTPEVIINEEDSKGSGGACENGSSVLRNTLNNSITEMYQLSQVEAILRNHGTEIKVQGAANTGGATSGGTFGQLQQKLEANGQNVTPVVNKIESDKDRRLRTSFHENSSNGEDDYMPVYGVETVFNNSDSGEPSSKSRRSRDGEKLFKCRLCPKSYSFSSALSRHKAVHNTMLRPWVCPICKKGFAEPDKLARHSRTHLVDKTWRCNNCGRIFKALNTFERHITTVCSYRNKENGGGTIATNSLPPGITAHPVNVSPQTVMYLNS